MCRQCHQCTNRLSFDEKRPNNATITGGYDIGYGSGPQVQQVDLNAEFERYVLDHVACLIQLEERMLNTDKAEEQHLSGLRVFVRLDVSIYRQASNNSINYMVNEVSRGHARGLFQPQECNTPRSMTLFSESMALAILSYACERKKQWRL